MSCAAVELQPAVAANVPSPCLSLVSCSATELIKPTAPPEQHPGESGGQPPSDFPEPQVVSAGEEFVWDVDAPLAETAAALGRRLKACGDLYRRPSYAGGLMLASRSPNILPEPITKGKRLAALIADRFPVRVVKGGKFKGNTIPSGQLEILLATEIFLQQFPTIDLVTTTPLYLPNYELTARGYTDNGRGYRILFVGESPRIKRGTDTTERFLDVMPFANQADRTGAVAAALTVLLRNLFLGAKPFLAVTANKSHAGKDTIIAFAAGRNRITAISYQGEDWALEREFVGAVKHSPDTAVVNIENARLGSGQQFIASAFLERFLCNPEPTLFSTGNGGPVRRTNDFVVAVSTNYGSLSTDLLNRCLPIHLEASGNVADRQSSIGNPKLEFLPRNAEEVEAELRGMIELWKAAGSPRDTNVHHPFSEWAAVVGGILMVNGFHDFLANYSIRRTSDDPLREGLALLGAARPNEWLTPMAWAELAVDLGLGKRVIPRGDQDSHKGRERGTRIVLSAHDKETFHAETDNELLVLQLQRARRRFEGGAVSTRYRFEVVERRPLPADADAEVDP